MKKIEEKPFNFFKVMSYRSPAQPPMTSFPKIDMKSAFYKNCKRQRKTEGKICQVCPFRKGIEEQEKNEE